MRKSRPSKSRLSDLLFTDLSCDLDHRLDWHALMFEAIQEEIWGEGKVSHELAEILFEYLGKRAALEHVFFGRALRSVRWEKTKLAAEVWRYRKIQAREALLKRGKG